MQRIDDPSNIPAPQAPLPTTNPGHFRRPSIAAGDQGTIITGDWAEDVQETIINPIETAGLTLEKGTYTQLTAAIVVLADTVLTPHAAKIATEAEHGHLEVATDSEVAALASNALAMTPHNLTDAFDVGSNANGNWIKFPTVAGAGKFCVQWGEQAISENFTITLPQTMQAADYYAAVFSVNTLAGTVRIHSHTTTQFEGAMSGHPADSGRFLVVGLAA